MRRIKLVLAGLTVLTLVTCEDVLNFVKDTDEKVVDTLYPTDTDTAEDTAKIEAAKTKAEVVYSFAQNYDFTRNGKVVVDASSAQLVQPVKTDAPDTESGEMTLYDYYLKACKDYVSASSALEYSLAEKELTLALALYAEAASEVAQADTSDGAVAAKLKIYSQAAGKLYRALFSLYLEPYPELEQKFEEAEQIYLNATDVTEPSENYLDEDPVVGAYLDAIDLFTEVQDEFNKYDAAAKALAAALDKKKALVENAYNTLRKLSKYFIKLDDAEDPNQDFSDFHTYEDSEGNTFSFASAGLEAAWDYIQDVYIISADFKEEAEYANLLTDMTALQSACVKVIEETGTSTADSKAAAATLEALQLQADVSYEILQGLQSSFSELDLALGDAEQPSQGDFNFKGYYAIPARGEAEQLVEFDGTGFVAALRYIGKARGNADTPDELKALIEDMAALQSVYIDYSKEYADDALAAAKTAADDALAAAQEEAESKVTAAQEEADKKVADAEQANRLAVVKASTDTAYSALEKLALSLEFSRLNDPDAENQDSSNFDFQGYYISEDYNSTEKVTWDTTEGGTDGLLAAWEYIRTAYGYVTRGYASYENTLTAYTDFIKDMGAMQDVYNTVVKATSKVENKEDSEYKLLAEVEKARATAARNGWDVPFEERQYLFYKLEQKIPWVADDLSPKSSNLTATVESGDGSGSGDNKYYAWKGTFAAIQGPVTGDTDKEMSFASFAQARVGGIDPGSGAIIQSINDSTAGVYKLWITGEVNTYNLKGTYGVIPQGTVMTLELTGEIQYTTSGLTGPYATTAIITIPLDHSLASSPETVTGISYLYDLYELDENRQIKITCDQKTSSLDSLPDGEESNLNKYGVLNGKYEVSEFDYAFTFGAASEPVRKIDTANNKLAVFKPDTDSTGGKDKATIEALANLEVTKVGAAPLSLTKEGWPLTAMDTPAWNVTRTH